MLSCAIAYDEKAAERVRHLLADRADLYERKLMGGIAFMVKGGMLVRVGPELQPRAVKEPHVRPMIMGGRTAKAFVRVMPEGYRTAALLKRWVQRGLDYVATLPPKPLKPKRPRHPAR